MTVATATKIAVTQNVDANVPVRLLEESYGPGAWHGPDLKAALADVSPRLAFWRPGPGRHNIAEIAVHHAYYVRSVASQLSGAAPDPFVLEGDDWFELSDEQTLDWPQIVSLVETLQHKLLGIVADIGAGRLQSSLSSGEQFDRVLGIACHAVYHAGQVQLIKVLGRA